MAAAGLLSLLDDITSVMDDVAALAKTQLKSTSSASTLMLKKSSGIVGDDLAVNVNQLTGIDSSREIPIIWQVAKGSLKNKFLYLIPFGLALSGVGGPAAIMPLLMVGGAFLNFEAAEKVLHKHSHDHKHHDSVEIAQHAKSVIDLEKEKIAGAVRTDFILSAEIVAISLGAVVGMPFATQLAALAVSGFVMTGIVYAAAAGFVKIDDFGLYLQEKFTEDKFSHKCARGFGYGVLKTAPYLMSALSIGGTAAMFMVGGGILVHGIPGAEALLHHAAHAAGALFPAASGLISSVAGPALTMAFGLVTGAASIPVVNRVIVPAYKKAIAPLTEKIGSAISHVCSKAKGLMPSVGKKADMAQETSALPSASVEVTQTAIPADKPGVVVVDVKSVLADSAARIPGNGGIDVTLTHYTAKTPGAKKNSGPA